MELICLKCTKPFTVRLYRLTTAKFCSKSCSVSVQMKGNTYLRGYKWPKEIVEKRAAAIRGFHHTEESKTRIGAANSKVLMGRKLSPETIAKMKGRVPWNKGTGKVKEVRVRKIAPIVLVSCKNCDVPFTARAFKKRKFCSQDCSIKFQVGENHAAYIPDRTKITDCRINDRSNRLWLKRVKDRDGWKCKISNGDCSERLEAHHILSWRDHPELRYELNNGITLCSKHHPRKHEEEKRLSPYFRELINKSV